MILLDNTKTLTQLASDTTNGLGALMITDCQVTNELNGQYECVFSLLTSDKHYIDLSVGSLVKVSANDQNEQIFRVYSISKAINGVVECHARHITYDLSKIPVQPFTATGAVLSCNALMGNVIGTSEFSIDTDITNTTSTFNLDIPRSFRECLGGYEGSLLDVFRGEYEWDNLQVHMLARMGSDNGVRIAYGKNLTDLKQEENIENVYTSVLGFAVVDDVCYVGQVYDKIVTSDPKVKIVDFSADYQSGDVPTTEELTTKATTYATNNAIEVPSVNLTISFVPLWQTTEYKNILPLERVKLGDTVHVFFEKLGVEASARVVKTVWNPLVNRYDSIELGSAKANLNTVLNEVQNEAVEQADEHTNAVNNAMNEITSLIINGVGLHKTVTSSGLIYLHNEEDLSQSQYQYRISSGGFELSDDYGQTWNSGWDIHGNAVVNALSTITLRALEIYGAYIQGSQIVFGDPSDPSGEYITAQPYGSPVEGVSFDGTGYVRFRPQEQFIINNLDAADHVLNEFVMASEGTNNQPFIVLKNYDHTQNYILANAIEMDAHLTESSNVYNRLQVSNYETALGTSKLANQMMFNANVSDNVLLLRNNKLNSGNAANSISLNTTQGITLYNYDIGSSYPGNQLNMRSQNSTNVLRHYNYKKGDSGYANTMIMTGYQLNEPSNGNEILIRNYDVDSNSVSDEIRMFKSTARNTFEIDLFRGSQTAAKLKFDRLNDGTLSAYLGTETVSQFNYKAAWIGFGGDGIVNLDGETRVNIACIEVVPVYINNKQLYFSGGYVRYYT